MAVKMQATKIAAEGEEAARSAAAPAAAARTEAAADTAPQSPAPFSWRRTALILGGSFALGIAIAWGAIAIGAHVVGLWPRGFAFYAMLVGGGVTMLLTAALMTAVFYSDSSGHDERVQQFRPNGRRRSDEEKRDG